MGSMAARRRRSSGRRSTPARWWGCCVRTAITEDDILLGRYDGAVVETWRVNWRDVSQRLLLRRATHRRDRARGRGVSGRAALGPAGAERAEGPALSGAVRCRAGRCALRGGSRRCRRIGPRRWWRRCATGFGSRSRGSAGFDEGWFALRHGGVGLGQARGLARSGGDGDAAGRRRMCSASPRRWATGWCAGDTLVLTAGCDRRFATCARAVRQCREFPRLSAHSGQRLRAALSAAGRRAATGGSWSDEPRQIVEAARGWLGTPYRHRAAMRGVGLRLPRAAARGVARALSATAPDAAALSRRLARRGACRRSCGRGRAVAACAERRCAPGSGAAVPARGEPGAAALRHHGRRRPLHPCAGAARRGRGQPDRRLGAAGRPGVGQLSGLTMVGSRCVLQQTPHRLRDLPPQGRG